MPLYTPPAIIEPYYVPEVRISGCVNISKVGDGEWLYTYYTTQWCPIENNLQRVVCAKNLWTLPALKQTAFMSRSVFGLMAAND